MAIIEKKRIEEEGGREKRGEGERVCAKVPSSLVPGKTNQNKRKRDEKSDKIYIC